MPRPKPLRSLLFLLLFYVGTVPMVIWALVLARIAPDRMFGHVENWARMNRALGRAILGIRLRIEGAVPPGACIVALKHEAALETLELLLLLPRPAVVLKKELTDIPLFGAALRAHGTIPVQRGAGASALRAMTAAAGDAIAAGRPIAIFPEGTRVPPGERPPLRPGFAGLYRALNLPVVPVALDSGTAWPKGPVKRGGPVTIRVGETIPAGLPRREIEARVHEAINALNGPERAESPSVPRG